MAPTIKTTKAPVFAPTKTPTNWPTMFPTKAPTRVPTTRFPTKRPTAYPSTKAPTRAPSKKPTRAPTRPLPFKIDLLYLGTPPSAEIHAVFTEAAARWSEIVGASLVNYVEFAPGTYCGQRFPKGVYVQDLLIMVHIEEMDGRTSGSPCILDELLIPRFGQIHLDAADVQIMLEAGSLKSLVAHSMGHVLGIGISFSRTQYGVKVRPSLVSSSVVEDADGGYAYLGAHGNQGNVEVGRTGRARVEDDDDGDDGAAGIHWKEEVYDNELMTSYAETGNTFMPISLLTAHALKDLGYSNVDLSKADEYTAPARSTGRRRHLRSSNKIPFRGCGRDRMNVTVVETKPKPGQEDAFARKKREFAIAAAAAE